MGEQTNGWIKQEFIDPDYEQNTTEIEKSKSEEKQESLNREKDNFVTFDKTLDTDKIVCKEEEDEGYNYSVHLQSNSEGMEKLPSFDNDENSFASQQYAQNEDINDVKCKEQTCRDTGEVKRPVGDGQTKSLAKDYGISHKGLTSDVPCIAPDIKQEDTVHCSVYTKDNDMYLGSLSTVNMGKEVPMSNDDNEECTLFCEVCGKRFLSTEEKNQHVSLHKEIESEMEIMKQTSLTSKKKEFICDICSDSFNKKFNLKRHFRQKHKDACPEKISKKPAAKKVKEFICEICARKFNKKSNLNRHILIHQDFYSHACELCGKGFKVENDLKHHLIQVHDDKRFDDSIKKLTCPHCPMVFFKESRLKYHLTIHSNEQPYACDKCDLKYKHARLLKLHKLMHEAENFGECKFCGLKLNSKSELKAHWERSKGDGIHNQDLELEACDICDKMFASKSKLKRHMMMHSDERPYECPICGVGFKQVYHLNSHVLTHQKEKRKKTKEGIMCEFCGLNVNTNRALRAHWEKSKGDGVHTEDLNNQRCEICDKLFKSKSKLERHMTTHSDERPFICTVCGLGFKQVYHLNSHMLTHQKEKPETFMDRTLSSSCDTSESSG